MQPALNQCAKLRRRHQRGPCELHHVARDPRSAAAYSVKAARASFGFGFQGCRYILTNSETLPGLDLSEEEDRHHTAGMAEQALSFRHKLVQLRTRAKNSLQALAFRSGSAGRSKLLSRKGRERFMRLPMGAAMAHQREAWLSLVEGLNSRIKDVDQWLEQQARTDERVLRLQTHPGMALFWVGSVFCSVPLWQVT